jgi:CRISPR-associated protein Cas1
VDVLWVFGGLDVNECVLVFLACHGVPIHFFNYYSFYAGTFCAREYLHTDHLVIRQARHYSNRLRHLAVSTRSREFIGASLYTGISLPQPSV